jgi:hypothetical protein
VVTTIDARTKPGRLSVALHIRSTLLATGPQKVTIWRTIEGHTEEVLRGVRDLNLPKDDDALIYDYEIPFNIPITYSIKIGAEPVVTSRPVMVQGDGAVVRDVLRPSLALEMCLVHHSQSDRSTRTAILRASGRRNPIAVTDIREGQTGSSTFKSATREERERFLKMADTGDVLFLTGPYKWQLGPLYFALLDLVEERTPAIYRPERVWQCKWVEVDPPQSPIIGTANKWSDVKKKTWLDHRTGDWFDLLYPPLVLG